MPDEEWQPVCRLSDLVVGRGATALVHGQAVALFRTGADTVHVLGNHDPFARASTIARCLVGRRRGVAYVASPAHGHAFDLDSGVCLDDPHVAVPAYAVAVVDGIVLVGRRKRP